MNISFDYKRMLSWNQSVSIFRFISEIFQIYIMAMKHESANARQENGDAEGLSSGGRLLDLVEKDLRLLAKHWFGVLLDYTYLMLPKQYQSQLPKDGGTFYRYTNNYCMRRCKWEPLVIGQMFSGIIYSLLCATAGKSFVSDDYS